MRVRSMVAALVSVVVVVGVASAVVPPAAAAPAQKRKDVSGCRDAERWLVVGTGAALRHGACWSGDGFIGAARGACQSESECGAEGDYFGEECHPGCYGESGRAVNGERPGRDCE